MELPLRECPFCGGTARMEESAIAHSMGTYYDLYIVCTSCGVRTPRMCYSINDLERCNAMITLTQKWNRRTSDGNNS